MYSNIIVYQIFLMTSIKVGFAKVQRLKESRLTIRGDGDQDPVASEDV